MLYPVSQQEILALINANNPGSPLKASDVAFRITAQEVDGTTTVEVTPVEGVPYYGKRLITYRKRDLAKSVLGVPVRLLVTQNVTVRTLIEMFASKYGYTFTETVDFAQTELDKTVDFGESGIQVVEIPSADTSLVWIGKLSITVSNDALDLNTIIANADLTNFKYLSGSAETASVSLITNAGDFSGIAADITAIDVGQPLTSALATKIRAILVKDGLLSAQGDELEAVLATQVMESKTVQNDVYLAVFKDNGTDVNWHGNAILRYGMRPALLVVPPGSGSDDFEVGSGAQSIEVLFTVNRTESNMVFPVRLASTSPSYATLSGNELTFKSATETTSTYAVTITVPASGPAEADVIKIIVSGDVNGVTSDLAEYSVTVRPATQEPDNNVYEFTASSGTFIVNLGTSRGTIDWGNGQTATYSGSEISKTLSSAPANPVVITVDPDTLTGTAVHFFGGNAITSCNRWVNYGISKLSFGELAVARSSTQMTSVPATLPKSLTSLADMFWGCSRLNDPKIAGWDVSKITNLSQTFRSATRFNQDLSGWNVSNVTDMSYLFSGCNAFDQDISGWDVSKVTSFSSMFTGCSVFNQNLSGWKVGAGATFSGMFNSCTIFNQPLNDWDVSNAVDLSSMFQSATAFNQPLDKWNTAKNKTMQRMFRAAEAFNQNISNWNVAAVTNRTDYDLNAYAWQAANKPVF